MAEEQLESRLLQLLKKAKSLVDIAMRQASFDLNARRPKMPVRGKVDFWTNCLLDQSDMPWDNQGQSYAPVDVEKDVIPPSRNWGDVVGFDVREEVHVRWLFQQLTPGVGIFDR